MEILGEGSTGSTVAQTYPCTSLCSPNYPFTLGSSIFKCQAMFFCSSEGAEHPQPELSLGIFPHLITANQSIWFTYAYLFTECIDEANIC